MTRPIALAVSPHLDDAAFSAGGTLAMLAAEGWEVVVATIFTASVSEPRGFALACQLDKGLGPEIDYMALRRSEDEAACRVLKARPVHLSFREAPHRGYGSASELFGAVRDDDRIVPDLAAALRALLGEYRPELIMAPQAVGGHVDHVQLVRALDAVAPTAPVAWWRDFPYGAKKAPLEPFKDRFRNERGVGAEVDPEAARAKRDACLTYASQLGFQFGGPGGLDAELAATNGLEWWCGAGTTMLVLTGGTSVHDDSPTVIIRGGAGTDGD